MTEAAEDRQKLTFTDQMRVRFKGILDPVGAFFNSLGLTPNMMTLLGLAGNTVGAIFLAQGRIVIGGILILVTGALDALDGTMARLRGEPSDFGAFVDSVTDRYSELVIFFGLIIYYMQQELWVHLTVVYLAAVGSVMVSYTRARAEALGYTAKVGILTRFERYIVLAPSLIFKVPIIGVGIIAVLANITAFQRIISVRRQARKKMEERKQ